MCMEKFSEFVDKRCQLTKKNPLNMIFLLLLEGSEGERCSLIALPFCDVNYKDLFRFL